jgi:lipid-binding SYLF domain-containing protein
MAAAQLTRRRLVGRQWFTKKENVMRLRTWGATFLVVAVPLLANKEEDDRLKEATTTLTELAGSKDKGIPADLMNKAVCTVVVPGVKKAGFIVGGKYGRGFASCRTGKGGWTAPAGMKIEGGSIGLQAGGSESDIVLLVMNKTGMEKLLKSKFTIGGEASAAAGPVGREAQAMTDAMMRAEILSWSRARGVFGGVSLQGSTLRDDEEANDHLYGKGTKNEAVLTGKVAVPATAKEFVGTLTKFSPAHK